MDCTADPRFLALALKAQSAFGKSTRMDDSANLEGRFAVLDMLDILDEHMAASRSSVAERE